MIDRDDMEMRLVTTLSPMLITLAALSISALSLVTTSSTSFLDEGLSGFAAVCVLSAALLIDFALDKMKMPFSERLLYLGGGYTLFCIAVGAMTTFIPIIYEQKNAGVTAMQISRHLFPFVGTGVAVFLKMMIFQDRSATLVAILGFAFASLYVISG